MHLLRKFQEKVKQKNRLPQAAADDFFFGALARINPQFYWGTIKNTLVNKNLRVIISEGLATASLEITGGF